MVPWRSLLKAWGPPQDHGPWAQGARCVAVSRTRPKTFVGLQPASRSDIVLDSARSSSRCDLINSSRYMVPSNVLSDCENHGILSREVHILCNDRHSNYKVSKQIQKVTLMTNKENERNESLTHSWKSKPTMATLSVSVSLSLCFSLSLSSSLSLPVSWLHGRLEAANCELPREPHSPGSSQCADAIHWSQKGNTSSHSQRHRRRNAHHTLPSCCSHPYCCELHR